MNPKAQSLGVFSFLAIEFQLVQLFLSSSNSAFLYTASFKYGLLAVISLSFNTLFAASSATIFDSLKVEINRQVNDSLKATYTNQLAFGYVFNNLPVARQLLTYGLAQAQLHQQVYGQAQLLNTTGIYFDVIGQKDSAKYYFETALNLSVQHGILRMQAMCLNNLGMFNWGSGNFQKALDYFFKALEINKLHYSDETEAAAKYENNIGLIYQELQLFDKALYYHESALQKRQQLGNLKEIAVSLANLGVCSQNLQAFQKAETYFLQAVKLAKEADDLRLFYALHDNLGNVYALMNKPQLAIEFHLQALNRIDRVGPNPKSDISTYGHLVSAYNKIAEPTMALSYGLKGLALLEAYPELYFFSADLHFGLAETYYRLGKNVEGEHSLAQYRNVVDSIFSDRNAKSLAEMEQKYKAAEKDIQLLEQEQALQANELQLQKSQFWFSMGMAILMFVSALLFFLYKQKEIKAKQVALELDIAAQNEVLHLQQERLRISRELHDNIGAYLTLLQAELNQLNPTSNANQPPQLQETLQRCVRELRNTVWLLNKNKVSIDELSIKLRDFVMPLSLHGHKVQIQTSNCGDTVLSEVQTTHLFRVLQEAINNAVKHGKASEIEITFVRQHDFNLHFEVKDNGLGFETDTATQGNGINNMRMRIAELNGQLHLHSSAKGTVLNGSFELLKQLNRVS